MITVFNRKELLVTYSMELQSKARNVLNTYGIDYIVRRAALDRGRSGWTGLEPIPPVPVNIRYM